MKNEILKKAAENLGLDYGVVDSVYKSYWRFVKDKWSEIPIRKGMSEEEFRELRTTFNHPFIGKFGCTWKKYCNIEKANVIKHKKRNENKKRNSSEQQDYNDRKSLPREGF